MLQFSAVQTFVARTR